MVRRSVSILGLVVLALGVGSFGFAQLQSLSSSSVRNVRQESGPSTASPTAQSMVPSDESLNATATTGELVFTFTLTIRSAIPKSAVVGCEAHANVSDPSGFNSTELGYSLATGSGADWVCRIEIPYSWMLRSPAGDSISLSYDAFVADGLQVSATNGAANTVQFAPTRKCIQNIASIKVPANGSTIMENVRMTL